MKRIVILISGQGRNMQAIAAHCQRGHIAGKVVAVISNVADAGGLQKAKAVGLETAVLDHRAFSSRAAYDAQLMQLIDSYQPDLLVLAGFMRILTPAFTQHYHGKALNIHPSLLPRHPGLHTHAAALAAKDAQHGASVHFVTADLDDGPCILQGALTIHADDTEQTLAARVMSEVELKIFPQAIAWFCNEQIQIDTQGFYFKGLSHKAPLSINDLEEEFLNATL